MNPSPELAPQLKQLRLSGILDSLEAATARPSRPSSPTPSSWPCSSSDEVARREQKKFDTRACAARPSAPPRPSSSSTSSVCPN